MNASPPVERRETSGGWPGLNRREAPGRTALNLACLKWSRPLQSHGLFRRQCHRPLTPSPSRDTRVPPVACFDPSAQTQHALGVRLPGSSSIHTYRCVCGSTTFFDNTRCLACGREQGFCPVCRTLAALLPQPDFSYRCGNCDAAVGKCWNYSANDVCNRCVWPPVEGALCDCCRFNATIPDLSIPGNAAKWYRLEAAKRRLFYDLDLLGLPYGTAADGIEPPLAFDFKANIIPVDDFWRPVGDEEQVYTGHANGRITINVREADDVEREKLRVDMGEAHRTLVGHFRHEIGHYYWDMLVKGRREEECKAVFGDHERPKYEEAMDTYYKNGPPFDWVTRYVSAYASMHPWEDFAEMWARYLAMTSALDTARNSGFEKDVDPTGDDVDLLVVRYQRLGVALNEINRGMGLIDLVPEVFVPPVVEKLRYVGRLVKETREGNRVFRTVDARI